MIFLPYAQEAFALLGILIGFAGYAFYLWSVFAGTTKPHVFTFFTYGLLEGEVALAQFLHGGGPGAWVIMAGAVVNFFVAVAALQFGERDIKKSDWTAFFAALLGVIFWWISNDAFVAVSIATFVNVLAVLPTFRKSFSKPYEESITVWTFDLVRFSLGVAALSSFTPTTVLFPIANVITNALLVAMILFRRQYHEAKEAAAELFS